MKWDLKKIIISATFPKLYKYKEVEKNIAQMKKNIVVVFLMLLGRAYAGNAPEAIQREFDQRFSGATDVSWERENPKGWIAEFIWQDRNVVAIYSFTGLWVETKTQIQLSELPVPVKETIESFYPDWKIMVATKIENAKNEILYRTAIQKDYKLQEIVLKEEGTLLLVGIE